MIRLKKDEADNTQVANSLIINNSKIIDENGATSNFVGFREIVDFSTDLVLTTSQCKSKLYNYTGSTSINITLPKISETGLNLEIFTGDHQLFMESNIADNISNGSSSAQLILLEPNSLYSLVSLTTLQWFMDKKTAEFALVFDEDISFDDVIVSNRSDDFHVILDTNGQAWSWGNNSFGKLGDNTTDRKEKPVQVCGGHTFCQIVVGDDHVLALDHLGAMWAWGRGNYGSLGHNSTASSRTPIQVCGGHTFCEISAGQYHSLAIDNNGQAWCWGFAQYGRLGDNTITNKSTPVQVCGGHTFCKISGGEWHSAAIDHLGQAWGWGYNAFGNLGDNTNVSKLTPVQVCGGHTFCKITTGFDFTMALKSNGEAWGWGDAGYGVLGIQSYLDRSTPVQVCGGHTFCEIFSGQYHNFAKDASGTTWAWGEGGFKLGTNDTNNTLTPVEVCYSYSRYISNRYATLGIDNNNKIWSWGQNSNGVLGINSDNLLFERSSPGRLQL